MILNVHMLKKLLGLPDNIKSRQAVNIAIRQHWPGGQEVLDAATRLHQMMHGRNIPNPELTLIADMLGEARNKIADAIRLDGVLVAGPEPTKTVPLQSTAGTEIPPTTPQSCPTSGDLSTPDGAPEYYPLLGTMPDTKLGEQVGVSHTWIAKMRRKYGIPAYAAPKTRIDWRRWDPIILSNNAMTMAGLAARIGCDESTLRERLRLLVNNEGKYSRPTGAPLAENRIDWSNTDWSLPKATIARQKGCTPQNVAAAYKRYVEGVGQEGE